MSLFNFWRLAESLRQRRSFPLCARTSKTHAQSGTSRRFPVQNDRRRIVLPSRRIRAPDQQRFFGGRPDGKLGNEFGAYPRDFGQAQRAQSRCRKLARLGNDACTFRRSRYELLQEFARPGDHRRLHLFKLPGQKLLHKLVKQDTAQPPRTRRDHDFGGFIDRIDSALGK